MRKAATIELDIEQRKELKRLSRSRSTRLAERSRIILLADEGLNNQDIAARLKPLPAVTNLRHPGTAEC